MRHRNHRRLHDALISAEEIACFVYCPEQWRLQFGQGLPAQNNAALEAGARHHARKAMAARVASLLVGVGRMLVVAAVLGLLALWLYRQ